LRAFLLLLIDTLIKAKLMPQKILSRIMVYQSGEIKRTVNRRNQAIEACMHTKMVRSQRLAFVPV
jgi:hypothetical protein